MTVATEPLVAHVHIAANHPSFAGHFPGRPLLPGVVLIAEVVEAIRADARLLALFGDAIDVDIVKFLAPVEPDSDLVITLAAARATGRAASAATATCGAPSFDFNVACRDIVVAKGRLSAGGPR